MNNRKDEINNNDMIHQLENIIRELNLIHYKMLADLEGEDRVNMIKQHMEIILKLQLQQNSISQKIIKKYDLDERQKEKMEIITGHFKKMDEF